MSRTDPKRQGGGEEKNYTGSKIYKEEDDVIFVQGAATKRKVKYVQANILRYMLSSNESPNTYKDQFINKPQKKASGSSKCMIDNAEIGLEPKETMLQAEISSSLNSSPVIAKSSVSSKVIESQSLNEDYTSTEKVSFNSLRLLELKKWRKHLNVPKFKTKIIHHLQDDSAASNESSMSDDSSTSKDEFGMTNKYFGKENIAPHLHTTRNWNEIRAASLVCPVLIRNPSIKNMRTALNNAHICTDSSSICNFETCLAEIGQKLVQRYISSEATNSSFVEYRLLTCLHCKFKTESRLVLRLHVEKRHKRWAFYPRKKNA